MSESTRIDSTLIIPTSYKRVSTYYDGRELTYDYRNKVTLYNYRNGVKNRGYKRKIQLRQNATTPLTGIKVVGQSKPSILKVRWKYNNPQPYQKNKETLEGYMAHGLPSDSVVQAISSVDAENQANSIYHLKANEAFREVYTGVIIGELKQTVGLIKSLSKRVIGATVDYNKSALALKAKIDKLAKLNSTPARVARRKVILQELSDLWLEYQFGVNPLANDINDIIEYMNGIGRPSQAIRAVTSDTQRVSSQTNVKLGGGATAIRFTRIRETQVDVMMFGSVSPSGSMFSGGFNSRLGLHPKDFLPTIYELTPWSFLIDYFANINAIIASVSNAFVDFDWTSKTVRKKYTVRYSSPQPLVQSYSTATTTIEKFDPGLPVYSKTWVERDQVIDVPTPSLDLKLPDSITKLLNISALYIARNRGNYS